MPARILQQGRGGAVGDFMEDLDQLTRLAEEQAENIRKVVAIVGKRMESEPELSEAEKRTYLAILLAVMGAR
jgi:hypothetical protein